MARAIFRRSRAEAWLALLALWLRALMPAAHHPAGMALAGEVSSVHNLCFAAGAQLSADPAKSPGRHIPACPICKAVHAVGGFPPPPRFILPPRIEHAAATAVTPSRPMETAVHRCRPQPRAPPIV